MARLHGMWQASHTVLCGISAAIGALERATDVRCPAQANANTGLSRPSCRMTGGALAAPWPALFSAPQRMMFASNRTTPARRAEIRYLAWPNPHIDHLSFRG